MLIFLILLDVKADIMTPPNGLKKKKAEVQRDQVIFPKSYNEAIKETPRSHPRRLPLYNYVLNE